MSDENELLETFANAKSRNEIEIMTAQIDSLITENQRLNNENQTLKKDVESGFFVSLFFSLQNKQK